MQTFFSHWWSQSTLSPQRYARFFSYFGSGALRGVLRFLDLVQGQMKNYNIHDPCKTLQNPSKNQQNKKIVKPYGMNIAGNRKGFKGFAYENTINKHGENLVNI